jgi:hypothetical protein
VVDGEDDDGATKLMNTKQKKEKKKKKKKSKQGETKGTKLNLTGKGPTSSTPSVAQNPTFANEPESHYESTDGDYNGEESAARVAAAAASGEIDYTGGDVENMSGLFLKGYMYSNRVTACVSERSLSFVLVLKRAHVLEQCGPNSPSLSFSFVRAGAHSLSPHTFIFADAHTVLLCNRVGGHLSPHSTPKVRGW